MTNCVTRSGASIFTVLALIVLGILTALNGSAVQAQQPQGTEQQAEKAAVERSMHSYSDAFVRGDLSAIAQHCNVPLMIIRPQEVKNLSTLNEIEGFYGGVIQGLKNRGYSHSTVAELHVKLLGQMVALVTAAFVRHKADGTELEAIGSTYILRKLGGEWKLVVVTPHSVADVIRVE